MEQLQIFKSPNFGKVRVMEIEGKPMFVANDIAKALGYSDTQQAIRIHCKSGDTSKLQVAYIPHPNGFGGTNLKFIDESNVNRLIMQSKLPSAEKFKDWVCEEVLPTIRKTGGYVIVKPDDTAQELSRRTEQVYKASVEKLEKELAESLNISERQDRLLKQFTPIVEYACEALQDGTEYSITKIAKGLGMSSRKLNKSLHTLGVQYKQGTTWLLYAKYESCGFTKIVPVKIKNPDGSTRPLPISKWTEKGRAFIHRLKREGKL